MNGYDEMQEAVIAFYLCSLRNDFSDFDWEESLELFRFGLESKLREHAQCDYDEFREHQEDFVGSGWGDEAYAPFTMITDYIYFGPEDVKEAIFKGQYEAAKRAFSGMFDHIKKMIDGIDSLPLREFDRIALFDSIIHAQHETGDIFDDLDTEELKDAANEMFEAEQEDADV